MGKKKNEDPGALDAELDAETARDIADLTKQAEDAFGEAAPAPFNYSNEGLSNPSATEVVRGWLDRLDQARERLLQLEQRCMAGPEGCNLADIRGLLDIVGR